MRRPSFAGMILFSLLFPALKPLTARCQDNDEMAIRKILNQQVAAWNRGNIDEFMKGYWNNDSLMFIGRSGVTYGYQNTLRNYKENYSDASLMGQLQFEFVKMRPLSPEYFFVVGKWHLKRSAGNIGGCFTLLFRKINSHWVIITDHSS